MRKKLRRVYHQREKKLRKHGVTANMLNSLMRASLQVLNRSRKHEAPLYRTDFIDMMKVYSHLALGNINQAYRIIWGMDTDARERIPNQVFNYIMDVVEFKQKKPGWGSKP